MSGLYGGTCSFFPEKKPAIFLCEIQYIYCKNRFGTTRSQNNRSNISLLSENVCISGWGTFKVEMIWSYKSLYLQSQEFRVILIWTFGNFDIVQNGRSVEHITTKSHWISPNCIESHRISSNSAKAHHIVQNLTKSHHNSSNLTESHQIY